MEFINKIIYCHYKAINFRVRTIHCFKHIHFSNISKYYLPLPFKISIPLGFAGCILINLSLSNNRSIL